MATIPRRVEILAVLAVAWTAGWGAAPVAGNETECKENCENGKCIPTANNEYSCRCNEGYKGPKCGVIKDCELSESGKGPNFIDCRNGAKAGGSAGNCFCKCREHLDFEGDLCDKRIDDCAGVTCPGNGQCVDGHPYPTRYTCVTTQPPTTSEPTRRPSPRPSPAPSKSPSKSPSKAPTRAPTSSPTPSARASTVPSTTSMPSPPSSTSAQSTAPAPTTGPSGVNSNPASFSTPSAPPTTLRLNSSSSTLPSLSSRLSLSPPSATPFPPPNPSVTLGPTRRNGTIDADGSGGGSGGGGGSDRVEVWVIVVIVLTAVLTIIALGVVLVVWRSRKTANDNRELALGPGVSNPTYRANIAARPPIGHSGVALEYDTVAAAAKASGVAAAAPGDTMTGGVAPLYEAVPVRSVPVYDANPPSVMNHNAMVGQVTDEPRAPAIDDDAALLKPLYEISPADPPGRPRTSTIYEVKPLAALNEIAMVGQVTYEPRAPAAGDRASTPMHMYDLAGRGRSSTVHEKPVTYEPCAPAAGDRASTPMHMYDLAGRGRSSTVHEKPQYDTAASPNYRVTSSPTYEVTDEDMALQYDVAAASRGRALTVYDRPATTNDGSASPAVTVAKERCTYVNTNKGQCRRSRAPGSNTCNRHAGLVPADPPLTSQRSQSPGSGMALEVDGNGGGGLSRSTRKGSVYNGFDEPAVSDLQGDSDL